MNKQVSLSLAVLLACATTSALAQTQANAENSLAGPRVFNYDQMKARTMPNGAESRVVFNGTLATGEQVGAHESLQPAATVPPVFHNRRIRVLTVLRLRLAQAEREPPDSFPRRAE